MTSVKASPYVVVALFLFCSVFYSCGTDYKDFGNENGRQAVIDQANNFLTQGQCDNAINTLTPLYNSIYADYEVKVVMASAYACKGGMNFPVLVEALQNVSGDDVWSPLVKANPSINSSDGHVTNLARAGDILLQSATPPGSFFAEARTEDANVYMTFVQLEIISSVISPLGAANILTGHKTQAIAGATASVSDRCRVAVAVATVQDSLNHISTAGSLTTLKDRINTVCGLVVGGCPTLRDYTACLSNGGVQTQGSLLIDVINTQWTL